MSDELMSEQHVKELMASFADSLKQVTLPPGLVAILVSAGEKAALAVLTEVGAKVSTVNFGANNALYQNIITVVIKLATQYLSSSPTPAPKPVVPTQSDVNVPVDAA